MSNQIKIKNWKKHQHYKNRNPPWIKIHRGILEDLDVMMLDLASRGLLFQLWILASESEGLVPFDENLICFRLRLKKINLKPLIDSGLIQMVADDASTAQADDNICSPERETETELEGEKEVETEIDIVVRFPTHSEVLSWWKSVSKNSGCSDIRNITDARWRKLKLRCGEGMWDAKDDILVETAKSAFLKSGGWFGFDWICKNGENWLKVVEGSYRDKSTTKPTETEPVDLDAMI